MWVFKCSMITWESTNMLKRISSSPVFYRTLFVKDAQNNTWILFHNFSPFESNAAGTFSRIQRNHFSIFLRFQPSNIEKK